MIQLLSCLVYAILLLGFALRRQKNYHAPIMLTAFACDLSLVLYIELTRAAIHTALHPPAAFVSFHVAVSVLTVALYFFQAAYGLRMYRASKVPALYASLKGAEFAMNGLGGSRAASLFEGSQDGAAGAQQRHWHKWAGMAFLLFRTTNLITSFWMDRFVSH